MRAKVVNLSTHSLLEICLLSAMAITLIIPPKLIPLALWKELSPLLYIRAFVWLLGLSILPGLYLLRLTRLATGLSNVEKIALGANLSFVLISLMSVVLYYIQGSIDSLSWLVLGSLLVLFSIRFLYFNEVPSSTRPKFTRWNVALLVGIVASIIIALFVQIAQQYLIPGDVWVSLEPAVSIASRLNVYDSFTTQYPLMFGFTIAGLSVCSGFPIVNSCALLFPLVSINMLCFLALIKSVFYLGDKVAVIASILYCFSGGFAWLIQLLVFHNSESFQTVSFLSQDLYSFMPFWNTAMFFHKTLALTLAYSSLTAFALSSRFRDWLKQITLLTFSSLFMLFSFFFHMLEALALAPILLVIAYFSLRGRRRFLSLGFLALITTVFAAIMDFLMYGRYSWLTGLKLQVFFATISVNTIRIISILVLVGISVIMLTKHILQRQINKLGTFNVDRLKIRIPVVALLLGIYSCGLFFYTAPVESAPSPLPEYLSSTFPWYLYATRYGFVGILGLIGVAATNWKEKWFKIAATWSILIIAIGSIWWGTRMNAYLFPMLALLAAVGINKMWHRAYDTVHIAIVTTENQMRKHLKIPLKPIMATILITTIALSFTSFIYGAAYYITNGPSLNDDTVKTLQWINKNTPQSAAILVPNSYKIYKSVNTIVDRRIYIDTNLPTTVDAASFTNLTYTLQTNSIQYALTTESISQQNYLVDLLLTYSNLAFQSGENRIYKLPNLTPPTSQSNVAVMNREILGLPDTTGFAWLDDSFTSNWNYKNVNVTTDGEVLTCKWDFHASSTEEPSMKTKTSPANTDAYPYLIISYQNTQETTTTAENNIGQIVTLINSTGYPKGFFKNIYLPISRQNTFSIFATKLPENQEVAEIWIWMRNYKKLNGTLGLQIDYIGLSSAEIIPGNPTNTRFIASIIPSMWQTNYSIFPEYDQVQDARTIVTSYSKDIYNEIVERTDTSSFVLFNRTITFPSWGTEWQNLDTNISTGYIDNKRIILCRTENINQENIAAVSENIYQQIQD